MARPLIQALAATAIIAAVPATTAAMAQVESSAYREIDQFMDVYARIKASYVEKVDDKTLIKGAIDGMLAALDPHSGFETGLDYDNLRIQTQGNYGGLGLSVTMEDGVVKIISAQEDAPGQRAGLKTGDYITHIDSKLVYGLTLDEAIGQMRGRPGTKVALTIVRPGRDKPIELAIVRERIEQKPVKWEIKNGIGVLNINAFSENTGAAALAAMAAIEKSLGKPPLGYIVDLRDNGGGLRDEAVALADNFLERGLIVSERGREKDDVEPFYARPGDPSRGLPVIVLINAGSASASEIVAGALQDHHRALVMGERSFGKGSVQTVLDLGNGTALRLTTSRYYTPSGRSVQEGGISPDIRVPQLSDPDYRTRPVFREADLRRHLINEVKADDAALEEDGKDDPRFAATPEQLKTKGIEDFQLDYALKTIARLGATEGTKTAARPASSTAAARGKR